MAQSMPIKVVHPNASRRWTLTTDNLDNIMKIFKYSKKENAGKVGWLFLWLIGVPVPVLLILFLLRGCT